MDRALEELARLTVANRTAPDADREREILSLRNRIGMAAIAQAAPHQFPPADDDALPPTNGVAEVSPDALTAGLVRAAIQRDGALLVRGLLPRDIALQLADDVQRSFDARDDGGPDAPGYYEEFVNDGPKLAPWRAYTKENGGVFAVDSPRIHERMLEVFDDVGALDVASGYLGSRPLLAAHKTTLRRVTPDVNGAWHQDGSFMHNATALNLWVSLSRCGDVAPGLEFVPRRLDDIVVSHDDMLRRKHAATLALGAAGDRGVARPIFEPGDALFFDEMFLHHTAGEPTMPHVRYALECWFFPASAFPEEYAPIAV